MKITICADNSWKKRPAFFYWFVAESKSTVCQGISFLGALKNFAG
jgi:hypothetical protein